MIPQLVKTIYSILKQNKMKKLLLGLVLFISISTLFACHIDPLGKCQDQSYFITRLFNPNSIYNFIVAGDTIETFTIGPVIQDSVFSLPIPAGTEVRMSYNYIGANFIEYSSATSASYQYSGCEALSVQFSNIGAVKVNDGIKIDFTNSDEREVVMYYIMGSKDSRNWGKIKSVQPTGQHNYSIKLGALSAAFLLPFLAFFKSKKTRPFLGLLPYLLVLLMILLFSCQKESGIIKTEDYKFVRVDAVKVDGGIISSEIKSL